MNGSIASANTAGTDAAITAALLACYTSSQVETLLGDYRTRTAQDAETTSAITGLLHLLTSGRPVGRLPHGKRAGHADAGRHHGRAAGPTPRWPQWPQLRPQDGGHSLDIAARITPLEVDTKVGRSPRGAGLRDLEAAGLHRGCRPPRQTPAP